MPEVVPQSWADAEPEVVQRERAAMAAWAPDMNWRDDLEWRDGRRALGWVGSAPPWGGDRDMPAGTEELLDDRRLEIAAIYPEAFPAVPAEIFPRDPEVPLSRRTLSTWHLNGDGSLCLMQAADDWNLSDTAADLVRKASGWFIEYLLLDGGRIERMTERGIFADTSLDPAIAEFAC